MSKMFGNLMKAVVQSVNGKPSRSERGHVMERCATTLC